MQKVLLALFLIVSIVLPVEAQAKVQAQAKGQPQFIQTAPVRSSAGWQTAQAEILLHWIRRAEDEAIVLPENTTSELSAAIDSGDEDRLRQIADDAVLQLLLAYHGKCCGTSLPANWHISDSITVEELRRRADDALATDQLDLMLRANQPLHPFYQALAAAYASETDERSRALLALNLARWRTLGIPATGRYLIVNAAAQEMAMWDGATKLHEWRVIVGMTSSPTPVFSTEVTGVVLNPWWEIPRSIAAEGIAAFVRRNPAAARAKGYVYSNGRYRQAPGDNNALGRMKLVMPNQFSVFLHDTSNRELFALDQRTLSHGCVRVDQALDFAALLLDSTEFTREKIDEVTAIDITRTIELPKKIPLFVAYFTAEPDGSGEVRQLPDIYGRDGTSGLVPAQLTKPAASSCEEERAPSVAFAF